MGGVGGGTYVAGVLRDGSCGARTSFFDGDDFFFGLGFGGFELLRDGCELGCFELLAKGRDDWAE